MPFSLNSDKTFETLALQDGKREVIFQDLSPVAFKNVYVSHSGLSLQGFQPVEITFFNNISSKRTRSLVRYTRIKRLIEKKISAIPGAAFIHHIWSNGYHHWICECLLKATYLDPQQTTLYLPEEYPKFAFDSLRLLGFQNIKVLPVNTGAKCKNAILVPNPTSGHFRNSDLNRIKKRLQEKLSLTPNGKRKLFISRKKASLRKIDNEQALAPLLSKYGYETIYAEELSFEDQVKLFSSCDVLISIHGAGLTNCIFMPEGSTVFEIYRRMEGNNDVMNLCYFRMTRALNQKYIVQFSEVLNHYQNIPKDRQDIHVDVMEFEKNLQIIEGSHQ